MGQHIFTKEDKVNLKIIIKSWLISQNDPANVKYSPHSQYSRIT